MQNRVVSHERIGIVGAGPVGSLIATYLAQAGISSDLYERRPDPRLVQSSAGRSINLAVSARGLHALREVGVENEVLSQSVPMKGRMIHPLHGPLTFAPYGRNDSECIYSVSRLGLNQTLLSLAESTGQVRCHFSHRVEEIEELSSQHPTLLGTDGSASVLRDQLMKNPGYQSTQHTLDYGYKELNLPASDRGEFLIEKNALHIWPRGTFMLIALPNFDGSFTCTLFLPFKGPHSFECLDQPESVSNFFSSHFPDVIELIPNITETFFSNPTGRMVTVKCSPWHLSDQILLLGDAAHAIVPFFGQGMNCGFEDCTLLNDLLKTNLPRDQIFAQFSKTRKPHTDAIADMAVENFEEMRDKVSQTDFLMMKSVEKVLEKKFPEEYRSRYSLVTFNRVPYRVALNAGIQANEILAELCQNLSRVEEVDLEKAAHLIRSKITPLLESRDSLWT